MRVKAADDYTHIIEQTAQDNSKVLHLAMHGKALTGGSIVPSEVLKEVLGICSTGDDSIDCIFFNACSTYKLASSLKAEQDVSWILSWRTDVDDEAAMCFAEAFYHYLGSSIENSTKFKVAYNRACAELKLRSWALINPRDQNLLVKTKADEGNVKLWAAGIPHLHELREETGMTPASPVDTGCNCLIS